MKIYLQLTISLITIFEFNFEPASLQMQLSNRKLREPLFSAHRTKDCCDKNMKCCKSGNNRPKLQMKAILVRCPNVNSDDTDIQRNIKDKVQTTREKELKSFQGYDEGELTIRTEVTNCRRKLLVTMKFDSFIPDKDQFIVIDHVFDPVTDKNQRILNPYVIKLRESMIRQIYPMKFISYVNSESFEVVHSKNDGNYTGCHTDSERPTCGTVVYKGKTIPYSQGFCCSCDSLKNAKNQPSGGSSPYDETIVSYSDPAHLLDGVECPLGKEGKKQQFNNHLKNTNNHEYTKRNNQKQTKYNIKKKHNCISGKQQDDEDFGHHQMISGGVQIRGGQNCADRYTPTNVDSEAYHESTHCLKFSEIWYGVNKLHKPKIEHSVSVQIYEKLQDSSGAPLWRDLTGKSIELNLSSKTLCGDEDRPTAALKYMLDTKNPHFILNYETMRILAPECGGTSNPENHPELKGGPSEFLVLPLTKINLEGDQCNIPGVGFEAFYKQPNRCAVPRGTCLANQPKTLWKHDKEAEKNGRKGKFFLKNFGIITENTFKRNGTESTLELLYDGNIFSTLDIEINADSNIVLRPNSAAMITEVYIDSTMATKTIITIKVTNSGLVSSKFMTKLNDCPEDLPSSFNNIQSGPVLIPPQHQHVFTVKINCKLPSDIFYCSAEVLNVNNELIALRRIKIQKSDRCICSWHCLCACVGSAIGLKCRHMSMEQYHAAGFQGGFLVPTTVVNNTDLDELLALIFYLIIFILLTLLMLGIAKAFIGCCCCAPVGIWGLDVILDLPKKINSYFEADLRDLDVEYDKQGWPLHPQTKKKVRNISRSTEFCMNVIFFFTYPIIILIKLLKRICCPYYTQEECTCTTSKDKCEFYVPSDSPDEEDICTCDEASDKNCGSAETNTDNNENSDGNDRSQLERVEDNDECEEKNKNGSVVQKEMNNTLEVVNEEESRETIETEGTIKYSGK